MSSTCDYLFEADETKLVPVLAGEIMVDEETDEQWYPVIGFAAPEPPRKDQPLLFSQLPEMTPDSGSFILLPPRRRKAGMRK